MKNYLYSDGFYRKTTGGLTANEIKSDEREHGLLVGVLTNRGFVEVAK